MRINVTGIRFDIMSSFEANQQKTLIQEIDIAFSKEIRYNINNQ